MQQEAILDYIHTLSSKPFITADIAEKFPEIQKNSISAALTTLFKKNLIQKTGEKRGLSIEYQCIVPATNREKDRAGIPGSLISGNAQFQINDLKKDIVLLEKENRALRDILLSLDNKTLVEIITGLV